MRTVITAALVREMERLRYGDGLPCRTVAARLGLAVSTVGKHAPGRPGKVSNRLLREAFERSRLTAAQLARRLEWFDGDRADTSRVRRTLGLLPDSTHGRRYVREWIDAETAYRIADELGVDRWDLEESVKP
jgi:transposase